MKENLKNFLLDLFFPKNCFGCQREGSYLCQDCKSVLQLSSFHEKEGNEFLDDLFYSTNYNNLFLNKMIHSFKYEPFARELAFPLASLITDHFCLLDEKPEFLKNKSGFFIMPIPLAKKRLKWRGFNQAEEIAKILSQSFKIPLLTDFLIKGKETKTQTSLSEKQRRENLSNVFSYNGFGLKNKKILLVDDVYTTGSTIKEAAKVLKQSGAEKVIAIVIARAQPEQDRI